MKKHSFAIKVCGITRQSDLSTAMGMGAHFCGFVFHPKSPRYIAPERAAALDSALIRRVGVFVNQDAEQIMDIMKTARLGNSPSSTATSPWTARAGSAREKSSGFCGRTVMIPWTPCKGRWTSGRTAVPGSCWMPAGRAAATEPRWTEGAGFPCRPRAPGSWPAAFPPLP